MMDKELYKRFRTADKMIYYIPAEQFERDMLIYTESILTDGIAAKKLLEGETGWWFSGLDTGWNYGVV